MFEIALVRIDERLIHGQVMSAWIQYANSHHIIIVDDATAKDPFLKMILSAAVPGNLKVDITTVEDAKNVLEKADDRVVILVKKPELCENGRIRSDKAGKSDTGRNELHCRKRAFIQEHLCIERRVDAIKGTTGIGNQCGCAGCPE